MAATDIDNWIPVEYGGALFQKFVETSALFTVTGGPGGRRESMIARTKIVPKAGDVNVQFTAIGAAYGLDTTAVDTVTITAKKMTGGVQLDEEDVADSASFVTVVPAKRDAAFRGFASLLDNAAFAVTGTPTNEPDMSVPYNSLYRQVKASNLTGQVNTWDRSSGTAAEFRTAMLTSLGFAEDSEWNANDLVFVADRAFRSVLRNQPVDGSTGLPIWSPAENTVLGSDVVWSRGLKVTATAVQKPVGNPLGFFAPRSLLIAGLRDPLSWRVSDPRTGIGALSDTSYLQVRQRVAFNIGAADGISLVELVP